MKTREEILEMIETLKREEKILRDLKANDTVRIGYLARINSLKWVIGHLPRISALKWVIRTEEENNNV